MYISLLFFSLKYFTLERNAPHSSTQLSMSDNTLMETQRFIQWARPLSRQLGPCRLRRHVSSGISTVKGEIIVDRRRDD